MSSVVDCWSVGNGPLAVYVTGEELSKLVTAVVERAIHYVQLSGDVILSYCLSAAVHCRL